jgi:hypothetical protein
MAPVPWNHPIVYVLGVILVLLFVLIALTVPIFGVLVRIGEEGKVNNKMLQQQLIAMEGTIASLKPIVSVDPSEKPKADVRKTAVPLPVCHALFTVEDSKGDRRSFAYDISNWLSRGSIAAIKLFDACEWDCTYEVNHAPLGRADNPARDVLRYYRSKDDAFRGVYNRVSYHGARIRVEVAADVARTWLKANRPAVLDLTESPGSPPPRSPHPTTP